MADINPVDDLTNANTANASTGPSTSQGVTTPPVPNGGGVKPAGGMLAGGSNNNVPPTPSSANNIGSTNPVTGQKYSTSYQTSFNGQNTTPAPTTPVNGAAPLNQKQQDYFNSLSPDRQTAVSNAISQEANTLGPANNFNGQNPTDVATIKNENLSTTGVPTPSTSPTPPTQLEQNATNTTNAYNQSATNATNLQTSANNAETKANNAQAQEQQSKEEAFALANNAAAKKATSDTANRQAISDLQYKSSSDAARQSIKDATTTANNMYQNMFRLTGTMGNTGSAGIDAMQDSVQKAQDFIDKLDQQYQDAGTEHGLAVKQAQEDLKDSIDKLNLSTQANVRSSIINTLVQAHKMNSVGDLDTPEAVAKESADLYAQATKDFEKYGQMYTNAMTDTLAKQQAALEARTALIADAKQRQTFDEKLSSATGQLMSAAGTPMLGTDGKPMQFNPQGVSEILSKNGPVEGADANGNQVMGLWVRKVDGTPEFQPVQSAKLNPDQEKSYVDALNGAFKNGGTSSEGFKQAMSNISTLDPTTQNRILSQMTPEVQVQMDKDRAKQQVTSQLFDTDPANRTDGILKYINTSMDDINKATGNQVQFARTPLDIAQAVEKRVEGGEDIGSALQNEFWQPTTAKPDYQEAMKNIVEGAKLTQAYKQAQIGSLQSTANKNNAAANGGTFAGKTLNTMVSAIPDGTVGGECGQFVNKQLAAIGDTTHYGDSLASKTSTINSQTPTVGSIVVMSSTGEFAPNGHVGVVTAVNDDGSIQMKSSNYKGDQTITTDKIAAGDPKILGYHIPPEPKTTLSSQDEGFAQRVADGSMSQSDLTSIFGRGVQNAQRKADIISRASELNSNVTTFDNANEKKFMGSWTSGNDSNTNKSLLLSSGHLKALADLVPSLQNGSIPAINGIQNWYKQETGQEAPTDVNELKTAFTTELAKTLKGGNASAGETEEKTWDALINPKFSPDQMNGALKEAAKILEPRLNGQIQSFKQTFGKDPFEYKGGQYGEILKEAQDNLSGFGIGNTATPTSNDLNSIVNKYLPPKK